MRKIIKTLLLVAWMAVIYMFSAQNGQASTNTSNAVIQTIYNILNYVLNMNILFSEFVIKSGHFIRKLAHFSEFFILGVLAVVTIKEYIANRFVLYSIIFCGVYALSDELHQLFVDSRACSLTDVCIDISGALLGILLYHLISRKWKRE